MTAHSLIVRLCLPMLAGLTETSAQGFNWNDYLSLNPSNQWVFTSQATPETFRFEVTGTPYFRASFMYPERGLDYRDNYYLNQNGLYWINSCLDESGLGILYLEFGAPGPLLCPASLEKTTPVTFSLQGITGSFSPAEGGESTPVSVDVTGSFLLTGRERFILWDMVLPVYRLIQTVQYKVSGGPSFTRNITTEYLLLYHYGPIHILNRSVSVFPPWIVNWDLGALPFDLPVYGTGYWANVPPTPPYGDKLTGIGWINDNLYPYIYSYSEGGYLWVDTSSSTTPANLWMWSYKNSTWIWANEYWMGWHFRFPNTWALW